MQPADSHSAEQTSAVAGDGSFSFQAVPFGSYFVKAGTLAGSYVDTVFFNDQQLVSNRIDVASGINKLDIELSKSAGAILAIVQTQDQKTYEPAASVHQSAALGVLYPLRNGIPDVGALSLTPAINGLVSIPELRPGSYLLFAVEHCDTNLWEYEDFVNSIANRGTKIEVRQQSQIVVPISPIFDADVGQVETQLGIVLPL